MMQTLNYRNKVKQIPEGTIIEVTGQYMTINASDFKKFNRESNSYSKLFLYSILLLKLDVSFVKEYTNEYNVVTQVYMAK
jgi:hypothetical protein